MKMTWKEVSKEQINQMLNDLIEQIFCNCDKTSMTKYEKRKRIYEYLTNNRRYNYEYFNGILRNYGENKIEKPFPRNLMEEFLEPLVSDSGICNGFSQIYKLLLEKVDVYSFCINCMIKHNNKFVGHQLNLVYDDELKTFSFDDVTFGIIRKCDEYFDYDNPEQNEEMQGCIPLCEGIKWMVIGDSLINYYAKRQKNIIQKPNSINIEDIAVRDLSDFRNRGIIIKSRKKLAKQEKKV